MTAVATRTALGRLSRPLRLRAGLGWAAVALGATALLLGAVAWSVRLGMVAAPWWVLAAWALALAALAAAAAAARRGLHALSVPRVARRLEEIGAARRGALTGLLDPPAGGTSESLLRQADQRQAAELHQRGGDVAEPLGRALRPLGVVGALLLLAGTLALTTAGPRRGAAAALWHPLRAWDATVAPVRIAAGRATVDRGDSVAFRIEAIGRRTATLWLRSPGESWRAVGLRLDSLGRAVAWSGGLQSDLFARVSSGGRGSDTVLVRVRLPVFLGTLAVTAHYPAYLGMEAEPVPTGGDTLLLPAGTRLETRGEATAPLRAAAWVAGERRAALAVNGPTFGGSFMPRSGGGYRLALATANDAPLAGDTVRLPIRLVADSAPSVEIPVPGADTVAPLSLKLGLVVDARDDHGLTTVEIESRRISRLGQVDAPRRERLTVPPEGPDRAILTYTLDLNRRGLLPGDTVRYFAVATDNTPGRQAARSREYVLRLPTMSEVRAAQRAATETLGGRIDSVTEASRRLERQTEDLAQERPRDPRGGDRPGESLSFEQSKRAESVARSQQELLRQGEDLKRSLEALRQSAEAAGVGDSAWQRQLEEIREQLARALTPELRERLAALQQALKDLDPELAKEALERLAEAQRQLREALERSRELFQRAALEGDLTNLSQEARDLAQEQRQWNQQVAASDSIAASAGERALAERADSLGSGLQRAAGAMSDSARQARIAAGAAQARDAGRQMHQAAGSARQGRRPEARQQGERAARQLEPLGDQLQQERQGMQQEWREEVTQAIDQALAETGRLAERQLHVQDALRAGDDPSPGLRAEQGAIEEGLQRLLDQVRRTAGKNALVSPQIGQALGSAQEQMQRTREAISSAAANPREAADQAGGAVDALNAAAYQLMRSRGEVSGAQSGSGLAEAMEQMAKLAQQQGGLGRQAAGLLPMAGAGAIQEQLRQLGARQRALAEQLQRMKGQGQIAGAGELGDEAEDLARRLESGRLDRQVVERQERLFRRMLDAGRTLQGREEDDRKERQSTTATDDSVRLPPALRARLQDDDQRLRVPTWDELQRLSPEERRLVVDYFRRLSESAGQSR
jgi:hypothetical protein